MNDSGPLILVIEDEAQMRRFLRVSLSNAGYRLAEAETAQAGLAEAASRAPDLVLLDLGLPDQDGLLVTQQIREWWRLVPIIIISARGREEDKIKVLDAGADDYVTKPFSTGELLARIRVALRRKTVAASGTSQFAVGDLVVDLTRRQVLVRNQEVHLTPIEYKLLSTLITYAGRVVTQRQLLREVWGPNAVEHAHYLRVYMGQLRHKLENDPGRPVHLLTEPGVGYRLRSED